MGREFEQYCLHCLCLLKHIVCYLHSKVICKSSNNLTEYSGVFKETGLVGVQLVK